MSETMWSPWRSEYIARSTENDNREEPGTVFTRRLQENDDEKNLILWRGEDVFVIMNLYPYNNGHMLIVPYREVTNYDDLTETEQQAVTTTIDRCIRWARAALEPDGFNVGMNMGTAAGAGIPDHLHIHVLPRWNGDTNFMPTTADVKVVPEALENTYRKLKEAISSLGEHPRNA